MRPFETLIHFNADKIKLEKQEIEEYIHSPEFSNDLNKLDSLSKLKDYLFLEAMEDPRWDPSKAQQVYNEIDKGVDLTTHLEFCYLNLLADEMIKELKNDRVKQIAYGETLYSNAEKTIAINWGNQFQKFIRTNTYQEYEERAQLKDSARIDPKEAEHKMPEFDEDKHENVQKKAYSLTCKNLRKFANEMEEMVNSVDYFMFGKGSPEFDKMKDKIVAFRKYAERFSKGEELDTETMAECLDRLNSVTSDIKTYIRKKQKELNDDPNRISDEDKQKREQPRIKTSIEMLEKAEMFYHKGRCGFAGRLYGELGPKLEAELKFEESFRANPDKMKDKFRFMDSAARSIRMLQEMGGSKYLAGNSLKDFYTARVKDSVDAIRATGGYSWLDQKDYSRFENGEEPKSRMECVLRDISNWYDQNKGNISEKNCLTTDKIKHILAVNEIELKPTHRTINERYEQNVKSTETVCAKYNKSMVNAPEKSAHGLGI